MQIRVVLCLIAPLLTCFSSLLDAQPAKNAKSRGIQYAYLDPQLQWHFVKETATPNGFDREYLAEVRVCYAQSDGCHWESTSGSVMVRESLEFKSPLGHASGDQSNEKAWSDAAKALTGRVIAKLGEDGWELIGDTPIPTFWSPPYTVVWFKRAQKP
jgi:hypothetical protein